MRMSLSVASYLLIIKFSSFAKFMFKRFSFMMTTVVAACFSLKNCNCTKLKSCNHCFKNCS